MEPLEEYVEMEDATVEVFADGFSEPSGLELYDGRLFVTDHGTNEIIAFDLDGNELDRIEAEADGIMGITVSPDGQLWYVDGDEDTVVTIIPADQAAE
jgi:hypothetical protein